ncbi:MAG TPA: glycosyltransferase family 9 protein [Syntrophales bacterium]|jgi:heptosyltransferase-3|nr:glycosyltransferase family 9 protein [Syntrophales bacterium]HOU78435.1 glycosyltransferase family 9 protein [Syntrophales bacterium]HPC33458.1 glycosyltransferase family 9 protein [Syntrophales bacterium]HQG34822.1 glycosyltransferase family 9 protein [Syntrophales bacterium]HQJ31234.1 glycosyltransferase family 9 protein [Syntrophales bacterium]
MIVGERFVLPDNIRKVLIIQLGDIGDVVWSLPAFGAVSAALPRADIFLLVREGIGALLGGDPAIAGIFEVERRRDGGPIKRLAAQLAFLARVRRARFDLVIDLRADERGAFMARLTGAPYRASLAAKDAPWYRNRLFTHLVYPTNENVRLRLGASEQTLRIIRQFGIPTPDTNPRLVVSPAAVSRVKNALSARGVGVPGDPGLGNAPGFVTLGPFSRWAYKEWPLENWSEIASWLFREYGLAAVVVGAAGERERAEALVRRTSAGMFNMAGDTTLGELAALLSLGRLHVGVDSAAPHVAAAVGTPTITIYGPSDWRDWAPVGDGHRVVTAAMDCSPCHQKGCDGQGRSRCLESISVDSVREAISRAVSPLR